MPREKNDLKEGLNEVKAYTPKRTRIHILQLQESISTNEQMPYNTQRSTHKTFAHPSTIQYRQRVTNKLEYTQTTHTR